MLHEILLALAGYPSPLLSSKESIEAFPAITPAEVTLLQSIRQIASLHRQIKTILSSVLSSSTSPVCRAVAQSILSGPLSAFTDSVLAFEKKILRHDSSLVGAYNIVPLAAVVGHFIPWRRRLEWLWDLSQSIATVNGAQLLDKLLSETRTGYSDIEETATKLLLVAERAWMRQLSAWLLSRRGSPDFFVTDQDGRPSSIDKSLVPGFLESNTVASLVFIGKTIRSLSLEDDTKATNAPRENPPATRLTLRYEMIKPLTNIPSPIAPLKMNQAVTEIRSILSHNLANSILPVHRLAHIVSSLQEFLLCQNNAFTESLIQEAERRYKSRQKMTPTSAAPALLSGNIMTDTETNAILNKAWASLSAITALAAPNSSIDWGRDSLRLKVYNASRDALPTDSSSDTALPQTYGNLFADFLLPIPTILTLEIKSPLDLFLSASDTATYSSIHSYLLSLTHTHAQLTNTWRNPRLRRHHPAPLGPPRSNRPRVRPFVQKARLRLAARQATLRPVWRCFAATTIFLAELRAYLTGDVVATSTTRFSTWLDTHMQPDTDTDAERPASANSTASHQQTRLDPELLSRAHRSFLAALAHALLLTDEGWATALRNVLRGAGRMTALVGRLDGVQAALDLVAEGVVEEEEANDGERRAQSYAVQEREVAAELRTACNDVDAAVTAAIERLRAVDLERVGMTVHSSGLGALLGDGLASGVWARTAGVDRLLMRLESRQ